MPATTPFPVVQTVSKGLFAGVSAVGLVQGTAYPDPATRWALRGGILDNAETIPMWGGVALYEHVPGGTGNPVVPLGPVVGRATTVTGGSKPIAGFSVFDQAYGMIQSPSSPVPLAGSGMQVMTYRLGSGARLAVACDPILASLQGGPLNASVAWDFVNQMLIPFSGAIVISSGTYNSGSGLVTLTLASNPGISVGDTFIVSGATGTGSFASINGTFQAGAGTTGTTVTYTIATGLTLTITGGSFTTGATALPCSVLDVQNSGCGVVLFNATTGNATWNFNGACAVIQI